MRNCHECRVTWEDSYRYCGDCGRPIGGVPVGPGPRDIAAIEQMRKGLRGKTNWPTTVSGWVFLILQLWAVLYLPFAAGNSAKDKDSEYWGWGSQIVFVAALYTIGYMAILSEKARSLGVTLGTDTRKARLSETK